MRQTHKACGYSNSTGYFYIHCCILNGIKETISGFLLKNKTSSQKEGECLAHPTFHFCEAEAKSAHHLSTKLVGCLNKCSERKAGKCNRKENLLRKETSRNHQCHSNWIHLAQSRASFSCSGLETFISKSPVIMIPDKHKKKGLTDLRENLLPLQVTLFYYVPQVSL